MIYNGDLLEFNIYLHICTIPINKACYLTLILIRRFQ